MTIQDSAVQEKLEGAALVDSLKNKIGTAALAGLLVPLGVAGTASDADAGVQEPPPPIFETIQRSHVESTVTPQQGGDFLYEFTVFNTSTLGYDEGFPVIVDWELPLFSPNGITNIQSPENWAFEIITFDGEIVQTSNPNFGVGDQSGFYNNDDGPYGEYVWDWTADDDPVFNDPIANPDGLLYGPDPDQFEAPNFILHWYTLDGGEGFPLNPILPFGPPFNQLSGFSFLAADSAVNAPYQASWFREPQTIGDPPTPQGAAIGVPNNAQVSEPGILALFATGLLGLLGLRRRRNSA